MEKIITAVQVALEGTPPQPIATECPHCFALVLRTRIVEHMSTHSPEGAE